MIQNVDSFLNSKNKKYILKEVIKFKHILGIINNKMSTF